MWKMERKRKIERGVHEEGENDAEKIEEER